VVVDIALTAVRRGTRAEVGRNADKSLLGLCGVLEAPEMTAATEDEMLCREFTNMETDKKKEKMADVVHRIKQ
jgi:hypothetical protein